MLQPLTLFLQRWKAEVFPTAEVPKGKFPPEYAFQHLGPVVQSIVSLTKSLVIDSLSLLVRLK